MTPPFTLNPHSLTRYQVMVRLTAYVHPSIYQIVIDRDTEQLRSLLEYYQDKPLGI